MHDLVARLALVDAEERDQDGEGDVRDRALLETLGQSNAFTHVLHAAAVTIDPGWEIAKPTWYIDVNIMGTVNVVDWARRLPELRRFVYVSSGAVYGLPTPASPSGRRSAPLDRATSPWPSSR